MKMMMTAAALLAALSATPASAQTADAPQSAPLPPPIAEPKDVSYPAGALKIKVDATDLDHRIFKIHETVPIAKAGDLVLMLPKWLPGHHSPGTEITKIADIAVSGAGKPLTWTRDPVDVYAFHIQVPEGVKDITVDFDYLSATTTTVGHIFMTADMLNVQWNFATLYPAGYYARRIPVEASLVLPAGWDYGTALETASRSGDSIAFKPTDFETLIDSPIYAGRYFKRFDLDPGAKVPVHLDVVADRPDLLNAPDDVLAVHRKLIQQAYKLYGSQHYDHYDFLVSASDNLGSNGLEHHRSSEDGVQPKYLTDWKTAYVGRDLLAHEFTHSWNGKFRRPFDLWTPNYQVPMRDSLLWVYEGQTQYWGDVLAARSGLYSKEQALQYLAITAAAYDNLPGRAWRDMEDTTNDPIIASRAPQSWRSFQRSEDYYNEGMLIWLDADTLIREKTGGTRSLDNFAHDFFGVDNGDWGTLTYKFDDVVQALNKVYAYDWATFLTTRLHGHGPGAPLDGFTRGGYRLVYTDTPTDFYKALETYRKATNLTYSIGLTIAKDNTISDELWDGPAYKAGLRPGETIIAVNGKAFDIDLLKSFITAAKDSKDTIDLLVKADDTYQTLKIDYHGGLRYPRLERIDGKPALLDDILAEKK